MKPRPRDAHWTEEQWQAIYLRDKNILVSAGAGSGKTAVLTERVFQRIKEGIHVNQLLVVTFTKAAALEMKERIRNRLIKAVDEGDESLFAQLNLLEVADISTFDSFSMSIVRKYGHLLGIQNDIQIGDSIALEKLKEDLLDQFLLKKHEEADPAFLDFIRRYNLKDGRLTRNQIMELTDNLLQQPDYESILKNDLEAYHTEAFYESLIQTNVRTIIDKLWFIKHYVKLMAREFDDLAIQDYVEMIEHSLLPLYDKAQYGPLKVAISEYKFPRKPGNLFAEEDEATERTFETLRQKIKDILKEVTELVRFDEATLIRQMDENYPYERTLMSLVGEFITLYVNHQIQMKYFDFQTIAYLSIKLLKEFPQVQSSIHERYVEILVDEYQDTSPLQDELIEAASHQNLYLVGDIKQSIYRFRDADPKIFQQKYQEYQNRPDCAVIHLNSNFRSRREVVEDINTIFELIFDERMGGVNYYDQHQMNFGLNAYDDEAMFNQPYGMTFLRYYEDAIEEHEDYGGKEQKKRKRAMFEADLILKDISDKMPTYRVFDKDTQTLRAARYDDFVILIDRKTYFPEMQAAFQAYGIPLHAHRSDTFLSNIDVLVTVNLFKLLLSLSDAALCEKYFKHAFLSLSYSYLFDFTTDDIIDFYTRIESLEPSVIFQTSLESPFEDFFKVFEELINEQEYLPLHAILMRFNERFGLVQNGLKLDHISALEERLIYIFEQLKGFDQKRFNLKELAQYYQYAIEHHNPDNWMFSIDIDYVRGTALVKDKVNMMTIHKSKGLEFPIVYYPHNFAGWMSGKSGLMFTEKYGLNLTAYDEGFVATLASKMLDDYEDAESLSERLRLFYVALTRSRESMIMIHHQDKKMLPEDVFIEEQEKQLSAAMRYYYTSFSKLAQSVLHALPHRIINIDTEAISFQSRAERLTKEDLLNTKHEGLLVQYHVLKPSVPSEATELEDSTLSFVHPQEIEKMALGSYVHEVLKNIDFKGNIAQQLDAMTLSSQIQSMVLAFFDQPYMERLLKGKIFKELPFVAPLGDTTYRGVIDLVSELEDEVIVVDYKMRNIAEDAYRNQVMRYVSYLHHKLQKPVSGYLYSLMDHRRVAVADRFEEARHHD